MLFSEPKIPQFDEPTNSPAPHPRFQCSSASRKFLNCPARRTQRLRLRLSVLFSEPKIPQLRTSVTSQHARPTFQCSSASRKFLNQRLMPPLCAQRRAFSALQRAENSSMRFSCRARKHTPRLSVLFSEPKIPQSAPTPPRSCAASAFQCSSASRKFLNAVYSSSNRSAGCGFQCSSASRKFLNQIRQHQRSGVGDFQCSSASRKFLNLVGLFPSVY